jgi:ABC-type transporter MlaC component
MKKSLSNSAIGGLLLFFVAGTLIAQTSGPLDVIRKSNQDVTAIHTANPTITPAVEVKMMELIDTVSSFATLSGRVIDNFRERLTPAQQAEFDKVFQELLRVSSIKKMGRYRADRFDYLSQQVTGTRAVVKTVAYYKEHKVALDYHLEVQGGKWVIVNYVSDNVDTIRNYQRQFVRLFRSQAFAQVMDRLRKRIEEYRKEI